MAKLIAMGMVVEAAMRGYVGPRLAADSTINLKPLISGITAKNYKSRKAALKTGLEKLVEGKLAKDSTLEDASEMLDALDDILPDAEEIEGVDRPAEDEDETDEEKEARLKKEKAMAKDKPAKDADAETDDDEERRKLTAKDKPAKDVETKDGDKDKNKVDKTAMDAALADAKVANDKAIKLAVDAATKATIDRMNAIAEAKELVRPYIGEIKVAMDSAPKVLKLALDAMKVDVEGVPEAAYAKMLKLVPVPGSTKAVNSNTPRMAMDAAATKSYEERFPGTKLLKRR